MKTRLDTARHMQITVEEEAFRYHAHGKARTLTVTEVPVYAKKFMQPSLLTVP